MQKRPVRRRFTAEYKLKTLNEIGRATRPGEIGAILRREGLYSSLISAWRKQRERGELDGLAPHKRGVKSLPPDPRDRQIKELERQNRKLQKKLERAHLLLDIQKKFSEITGIPLVDVEEEDEDDS